MSILEQIKDAVEKHEAPGWCQWYVDEFVIDCDAEEFWQVVEQVLLRTAGGHMTDWIYLVNDGETQWEVTREEWLRVEREQGFIAQHRGEPATWSFSGPDYGGKRVHRSTATIPERQETP